MQGKIFNKEVDESFLTLYCVVSKVGLQQNQVSEGAKQGVTAVV